MEAAEAIIEVWLTGGGAVPNEALLALKTARREYKELNRICLRHAAKQVDDAEKASGRTSDFESAVIVYDVRNPI